MTASTATSANKGKGGGAKAKHAAPRKAAPRAPSPDNGAATEQPIPQPHLDAAFRIRPSAVKSIMRNSTTSQLSIQNHTEDMVATVAGLFIAHVVQTVYDSQIATKRKQKKKQKQGGGPPRSRTRRITPNMIMTAIAGDPVLGSYRGFSIIDPTKAMPVPRRKKKLRFNPKPQETPL